MPAPCVRRIHELDGRSVQAAGTAADHLDVCGTPAGFVIRRRLRSVVARARCGSRRCGRWDRRGLASPVAGRSVVTSTRRVALVTGASRGIGRAVARELAQRGYETIATMRDPSAGASLADEAHASGWSLTVERL